MDVVVKEMAAPHLISTLLRRAHARYFSVQKFVAKQIFNWHSNKFSFQIVYHNNLTERDSDSPDSKQLQLSISNTG